ncbi:trigger factor [Desulfovibrio litoralis]|uniref:Trigger factor n=1 Tax=Desulfovibrio litoralis DSM 11393 TaxID=1121455 RepID=A0A1M7SL82_9BACT|nr:trigger factor [Desulfovibrio litoralis]SHN59225.1 trigger factor [Desulfovibrio litoralis DSM 11393]
MDYTVEDLSAVKKKVSVTVPVEEVEAALSTAVSMYRSSVSLDGFRKGKVPVSVVEKRFKDSIYREATTDLVNVHINQIITELKCNPLSRIDFKGKELERGKEFKYEIAFEVAPEIELPNYEGFEVEYNKPEVNEAEVDEVLARINKNMSELVAVSEERKPQDGDIASIDFIAYDENGKEAEGIKADNFQMHIGERQALEDFENLVKTIPLGKEGEGDITFPADFINPEFANKTYTMKIKVHAIQERKLTPLDDEFAKKAGNFESLEKMKESIRGSYMQTRENLAKSQAQHSMVEGLLKMVDFPLPEGLVDNYMNNILVDMKNKLERQGKNLESLGKTPEELRNGARSDAESLAKVQLFLLAVAKKEGLSVEEEEVDRELRSIAVQGGHDYKQLKDHYIQNNLIFALRDRILGDKAMELMYSKAKVVEVEKKAE